jgi:hypothetical protein
MCTPNEYRRMVLRLHLYLCKGCLNSQFTKYLPPLSKVYISVYNSLVIEIDLPVKDAALICLAVFLFPRSDIAAIRPQRPGLPRLRAIYLRAIAFFHLGFALRPSGREVAAVNLLLARRKLAVSTVPPSVSLL